MTPTTADIGIMLQTIEQARKCADLADSVFQRGRDLADRPLIVQERWRDLGKRVECIEHILKLDDVSAMQEPTWKAIDKALAKASDDDGNKNTINLARRLIVAQKALVEIRRYKLDKQVADEFSFESFAGKLRHAIEKLAPIDQSSSSASSLVSLASGDISLVLLRSIEQVVLIRLRECTAGSAENQPILDAVLSLVEQENVFRIHAFKGALLREIASFISDWELSPESQQNVENTGQIEDGIHAQRGFHERHKRRANTVSPEAKRNRVSEAKTNEDGEFVQAADEEESVAPAPTSKARGKASADDDDDSSISSLDDNDEAASIKSVRKSKEYTMNNSIATEKYLHCPCVHVRLVEQRWKASVKTDGPNFVDYNSKPPIGSNSSNSFKRMKGHYAVCKDAPSLTPEAKAWMRGEVEYEEDQDADNLEYDSDVTREMTEEELFEYERVVVTVEENNEGHETVVETVEDDDEEG